MLFKLFTFQTCNCPLFSLSLHASRRGNLLSDSIRLTRFGKFLRSLSLDELPELFNILRGEMSLVGPRPLLMEYLPLYSAEQMRRHDVYPGVTGWAQAMDAMQLTGRFILHWMFGMWIIGHLDWI